MDMFFRVLSLLFVVQISRINIHSLTGSTLPTGHQAQLQQHAKGITLDPMLNELTILNAEDVNELPC
jgi:hypothetical protein